MTATPALPPDIPFTDAALLAWLREEVPALLDEETAHTSYLLMHPRIAFLKTLPLGSVVFDVGAGDGALRGFREWLGFPRLDLRFVGAGLDHGAATHLYESFLVGDLESAELRFGGPDPTCAVLAHFIEHLHDPAGFLRRLAARLPPGAPIYMEWPSEHARRLPSLRVAEAAGFALSTLNFHDDATHVRTFTLAEAEAMLQEAGFAPMSRGHVSMPFLADQLKRHGVLKPDPYLLTIAAWLKTLFASHITAIRI